MTSFSGHKLDDSGEFAEEIFQQANIALGKSKKRILVMNTKKNIAAARRKFSCIWAKLNQIHDVSS